MQEVVARIDLYEGATPELATKVLLDTALMREVAATPEEAERENKIHNAIVAAAAEHERMLAEAQKREVAEREARRGAEAETRELALQAAAEHKRAEEAARELTRERALFEAERRERKQAEEQERERLAAAEREHTETVEALFGKLDSQASELATLKEQLDGASRLRRVGVALALPVVAILAVTLSLDLDIVSGPWPVTLLVICGALLASGGLGFVFGHKRVWAALGAIGVVLGLAVEFHQIVAESEKSEPPPKTQPTESP